MFALWPALPASKLALLGLHKSRGVAVFQALPFRPINVYLKSTLSEWHDDFSVQLVLGDIHLVLKFCDSYMRMTGDYIGTLERLESWAEDQVFHVCA